jgi:hypothetical protein
MPGRNGGVVGLVVVFEEPDTRLSAADDTDLARSVTWARTFHLCGGKVCLAGFGGHGFRVAAVVFPRAPRPYGNPRCGADYQASGKPCQKPSHRIVSATSRPAGAGIVSAVDMVLAGSGGAGGQEGVTSRSTGPPAAASRNPTCRG